MKVAGVHLTVPYLVDRLLAETFRKKLLLLEEEDQGSSLRDDLGLQRSLPVYLYTADA